MQTPHQSAATTPFEPPAPQARPHTERHTDRLQRELENTQQALTRANRENRQFKALLDHLPAMVGYWDAAKINRFANHAYVDWFGKRPEDINGRHIRDLLGPHLYGLNSPFMDLALAGQPQRFERTITNPESGARRISLSDYVPHVEGGEIRGFFVMVSDISAQKEAETQLQQLNADLTTSHSLLRTLSAHNETRIENERKHFAREVHDELGQVLTALRMDLLILEMRFCKQNEELWAKVQEMQGTLNQAFQSIRDVAGKLRPAALDMGLTEALRWLSTEFSRKSGVPCDFETNSLGIPDERVSNVLFRIVQESLTNITRYAQASRVHVCLEWADAALHVSVQDDGIGFDQTQTPTATGYGLLGMRERALALGGEVRITSAPGQGTQIAVRIPWQPALTGTTP
jgi:PAS domain S-box-containing protein